LAIITTADLQSHVFPFETEKIVDGKKVKFTIGGLDRLAALIVSIHLTASLTPSQYTTARLQPKKSQTTTLAGIYIKMNATI
jgi:2',3'-cyclic-nucleotide 2'-phosphodiesterase (5'-nucleotidase family)